MRAPGHHGHLRTKGQSLNRASRANPAIGLVSCRSDRHAMSAFSLQLSSGELGCRDVLHARRIKIDVARPHGPDDSGKLVGHGNGRFIVTASRRGVGGPLLQARQAKVQVNDLHSAEFPDGRFRILQPPHVRKALQ